MLGCPIAKSQHPYQLRQKADSAELGTLLTFFSLVSPCTRSAPCHCGPEGGHLGSLGDPSRAVETVAACYSPIAAHARTRPICIAPPGCQVGVSFLLSYIFTSLALRFTMRIPHSLFTAHRTCWPPELEEIRKCPVRRFERNYGQL